MIIPIDSSTLPETSAQFRAGVLTALGRYGVAAHALTLTAPAWPDVVDMELDLSGATLERPDAIPRVERTTVGTVMIGRLVVEGKPLNVHGLPLNFAVSAHQALLQMTALSGEQHALVLQTASDGTLDVSAQRADLERLAHNVLSGLAKQHGADLLETKLRFSPRGSRAVSFEGEVTAKVMMMKANLTVAGDLDLSDDLQLQISNLRLAGGGMAAGLARGFLQPHFDKLQQKPISLSALALGEVRLRDVGIAVEGDTLRILAKFGS